VPPFASEGVDKVIPETLAVITAYEQQMRRRASATAKDTLESTDALHSLNAIPFIVGIIS